MMKYRSHNLLSRLAPAIQTYTVLWLVQPAAAFAANGCATNTPAGVLVAHKQTTFGCYLNSILGDNMPYVILVAVVLVIASGIQYMIAQGVPGEQAKARTRILGILGGIVFYFLIRYLAPLITGGLTL